MIKTICRVFDKEINELKSINIECDNRNVEVMSLFIGKDFASIEFEFNITSSITDEFQIYIGISGVQIYLKNFKLTSTGPEIIKFHYNDIKEYLCCGNTHRFFFDIKKIK
jgi:hypothetical protein